MLIVCPQYASPGPVLLRRFVRNKDDPLCDQVLLVDANPSSARILLPNGKENIVSTSDLAPCPGVKKDLPIKPQMNSDLSDNSSANSPHSDEAVTFESNFNDIPNASNVNFSPRRSGRTRRARDRYGERVK